MSLEQFVSAISRAGITPCVKFDCPKREQCSAYKMACTAFRHYVKTGQAKDPHDVIPDPLTRKNQPVTQPFIAPSREIFDSLDDIKCHSEGVVAKTKDELATEIVASAIKSRSALQSAWA